MLLFVGLGIKSGYQCDLNLCIRCDWKRCGNCSCEDERQMLIVFSKYELLLFDSRRIHIEGYLKKQRLCDGLKG